MSALSLKSHRIAPLWHRLVLLAVLAAPVGAHADFESAAAAYRLNDYEAAFNGFLPLAEAGDARAQTVIAMMYKYGESVPLDLEAAFDWYLRAAEAGYAPAMFNVGEMYRLGKGTGQDDTRAIEWLTRAAAAGYHQANDSLAALNAEPVASDKRADPTVPWSKAWNFRLPNDIRFSAPAAGIDATIVPDAEYRVQLGAMRTRAGASRLWDWLAGTQPLLFDGLSPVVLLTERDDQSLYRVQASPFEDLAAAKSFCARLKRVEPRAECLPVH